MNIAVAALLGCNAFDENLLSGEAPNAALAKPPPRPRVSDDEGDERLTIALRDVVLRQDGDAWRTIGLDLDDVDSQDEGGRFECVPPRPTADPELDGERGIDNAFGHRLFPIVDLALQDLEEKARAAQERGAGTVLLHMRGWNGTVDDPRVDVFITQAVDGTTADPSRVELDGFELVMKNSGDPAPDPAWQGQDHWWVREDTFFMGDIAQPKVRDDNAYVANGTIVVRLPDRVDLLFFAGDAGVRVRLTAAFAVGTLSPEFDRIDGATIAGRWGIYDILESGDNIGICNGSAQQTIVEAQLDTIADVRSRPGTGGADVPCDAVSLGVRFDGIAGNLEDVAAGAPLPNPCGDPAPGNRDGGVPPS